jgi:hypothetical protein
MPNKRISELSLLTTPQLGTMIPVVENGQTQKLPVGTLLQSGLPISASSITATSIHVEGNITADSFTVVSSSIIYATGSTNFGDSFDDFHTFTGSVTITGSTTITGSVAISGSSSFVGNHILSGTSVLTGNTVISGSLNVSGSSNFHNSIFIVTGSQYLTGSQWITGSLSIYGDVNVVSGSNFYRWGNKLFNYGAFFDTRTQSASLNTATSMLINTGDVIDSGVHITSGSRITFDNTGVYNIQFSVQLNRIGGSGTVTPTIWLAYTGSNVANSATDIVMTGNANDAAVVPAWNWVLPIKANDWVEVKWSTPDVNIVLFARGSRTNPVRPAVPSVIITATQIA